MFIKLLLSSDSALDVLIVALFIVAGTKGSADFEIVVMAWDVSSTTGPRALVTTELSSNRMPDSSGLCSVWIVFFTTEVYLSIKVNWCDSKLYCT